MITETWKEKIMLASRYYCSQTIEFELYYFLLLHNMKVLLISKSYFILQILEKVDISYTWFPEYNKFFISWWPFVHRVIYFEI